MCAKEVQMNGWVESYRAVIGSKISALIWMPMASDTPDLVSAYKSPSFSFTGGVFLGFSTAQKVFLTWRQEGYDTFLGEGLEFAWGAYALDRVRCDQFGTWGVIEQSTLRSVELFSAPSIQQERIVGIRHSVVFSEGETHFWIGTGGAEFVGDSDDLWVGIGVEPPNLARLTSVGKLGD